MDTAEALKCIQYFWGQILPKANSCPCWTEEDIIKTFKWAENCEQVYQSWKDKLSAETLDENIHSLTIKDCEETCFEDLKHSAKILLQAFFENPDVENNLLENLLVQTNCETPSENFKNVIELDSLCIELLETVKSVSIQNSDRSLYYEIKAELLIDFWKKIELKTEAQMESHLFGAFEKLCEDTDKMTILLHVLLYKAADTANHVREIQEICLTWVVLKIASDETCQLAQFLWKQSAANLRLLSEKSASFYNLYFDFLIKNVYSIKPEFEDFERGMTSPASRFNASTVTFSFEEIVNHFHCLLSEDDEISDTSKINILKLVNNSTEPIWREIYFRIS